MDRPVDAGRKSPSPLSRDGRAPPLDLRREGMDMTIVEAGRTIVGGVDTHLDAHVAAGVGPHRRCARSAVLRGHSWWLQGTARVDGGVRDDLQGGRGGHWRLWSGARAFPASGRRRGDRGRPPESPGPADQRQVRSRRRRRGGTEPVRAAGSLAHPRPETATSRRSGRCWWPSDRLARLVCGPSTKCAS